MPNTDIDLRTIAKEQVAIRRNLEDINLSLKQTFLALDDISLSLRQTLFVLKNMSEDLHQPTEEEMMDKATAKFINEYIPKKFVDENAVEPSSICQSTDINASSKEDQNGEY